ncbi:MAG: zinc ABC transporter substrate-binding protein [Saprospiraceae bacterium]|nr:zinc ABC transporter substrate-binding protein [Saprospiraceae bacterium]
MSLRIKSILYIASISLIFLSCSQSAQPTDNGKIKVVCTTGMIEDALINSLDTNFSISALMGPGVDPHLYKATPKDLQLLRAADVIVYNGLHLEGKLHEVFNKLSKTKHLIAVADGIAKDKLRSGDEMSYDPHIWFDVMLWSNAVEYCSYSIRQLYPEFTNSIKPKTNAYLDSLKLLNDEIKAYLNQNLNSDKRILITAHDAFGYFGQAYEFKVLAIKGMSTVSDVNLKHVNELSKLIIQKRIRTIFPETSLPEGNVGGIVEACNKLDHPLKLGSALYSDALGLSNTGKGTYVGMFRYNVKSIVEGLKDE